MSDENVHNESQYEQKSDEENMTMDIFFQRLCATLDDFDIPFEILDHIFDDALHGNLNKFCKENETVEKGVIYWNNVYKELKIINENDDSINDKKQQIKELAKKFVLVENEFTVTYFIFIQHLSKAVIHKMWSIVYSFHPTWHCDPSEALRDALVSKKQRASELFSELIQS